MPSAPQEADEAQNPQGQTLMHAKHYLCSLLLSSLNKNHLHITVNFSSYWSAMCSVSAADKSAGVLPVMQQHNSLNTECFYHC